jgi:hypothetical protein
MERRFVKSFVGAGALALIAATAWAGGKNRQYYPNDMSNEDIKAAMKVLGSSLGVECAHCHQIKPKRDWTIDTDAKKIARSMLVMTDKINKDCFNKDFLGVKDGDVKQGTCFMCHKGKEKPEYKPASPDDNKKFEALAKDDKNKAMAASMKKLVDKLNKDFFTWKDAPKATCWMCHHGSGEIVVKAPDSGD